MRTAARVVLIDRADRVLLLGARNPDDQRVLWFMPGGGVEPGESLEPAAARELAEEVPAAVGVRLLGPIWRRHDDFTWAGHPVCQSEWFFIGRLAESLDAAVIRMSGVEATSFVEARWLTLAELREWPALVAPRRMAEQLAPILALRPA